MGGGVGEGETAGDVEGTIASGITLVGMGIGMSCDVSVTAETVAMKAATNNRVHLSAITVSSDLCEESGTDVDG